MKNEHARNVPTRWYVHALRWCIVGIAFAWIAGQLSQITDWSGVGQWIVSGLIVWMMLEFVHGKKRWVPIVGAVLWSGALFVLLYAAAASHAPYGGERLPAWTMWFNPILIAAVPLTLLAIAVFVVPLAWKQTNA